MRVTWAIVLAGCGRFGFDGPSPDASDPGRDGISGAEVPELVDAQEQDASIPTSFDYADFVTCPPELTLVGSARCIGGELELTSDTSGQTAAVWVTMPYAITSTSRFSLQLELQFGNAGGTPGDGMTVVFQADPRGVAAINSAAGGNLGYASILPSVALELDTFANPGFSDISNNHVGLDRDGNMTSIETAAAPVAMSNGTAFTVWFDYDGPSQTFTSYLAATAVKPATPLFMVVEDLARLGVAYIGLTASAGIDHERHHVRSWRLDAM